jgi:hypothetical protein
MSIKQKVLNPLRENAQFFVRILWEARESE